jgi:hypothetical protein
MTYWSAILWSSSFGNDICSCAVDSFGRPLVPDCSDSGSDFQASSSVQVESVLLELDCGSLELVPLASFGNDRPVGPSGLDEGFLILSFALDDDLRGRPISSRRLKMNVQRSDS